MNEDSKMGTYGLKGNDGFIADGNIHLSASYDSNGEVFTEIFDGDSAPSWERMKLTEAVIRKATIISCSECDLPAVSLDHHWPYHTEMNFCKVHYENNKGV